MFELNSTLKEDTILLASLPLCELLLMNESQFPWFILVPRKEGLRELIELSDNERELYTLESNAVSHMLLKAFHAEKLNVAALGNVIAQLHVHHIARFVGDAAWPKPVWDKCEVVPYSFAALESLHGLIKTSLSLIKKDDIVWHV